MPTTFAGIPDLNRTSVVFPDTEFPNNWNEIRNQSASVGWAPRCPPETYRALAERTLESAGFACDAESLDRISNDCNLVPEIREAFRLLMLYEFLTESNRQFSELLAWAGSHKLPDGDIDFMRFLYEDSQKVAGEIYALGERIKARESEQIARIGKKIKEATPRGSEAVHGTPEQKASRWKTYQDELNRVCTSGVKYPKALKTVGAKFKVHPRTIRRHTSNPTR
jgi:hypothetical protein